MSKIKNKSARMPSPYDSEFHNTEWTVASKYCEWINEIIKDEKIELGEAVVETISKTTRKRSDIQIYESKGSKKEICVIECKQPFWDVYSEELKQDALHKAQRRKAKYFCTTNFRQLIWWKTAEANDPTLTEADQIVENYTLSDIYDLDHIEQTRFKEPTKKQLKLFLQRLYKIYFGKEPEPKHPIDEYLIFRLHEKIRVLSNVYPEIIKDKCHKDTKFRKELQKWFHEQGWDFLWQSNDFDKAARQTAYLLVNKIIFYDLLQNKRPHELDPLEIPSGLTKGNRLQSILQGYFGDVLKIDYETVYTTDFIDTVAFPDNSTVIREIKDLITFLSKYDFSKLGFDIIGRIFERLIPAEERHNLGQYFTNADVVDLILKFCMHHEDDKVLDPSCGAGTFIVRAYHHKKLLNQQKPHEDILQKVWGNDIAKFPAHLSTINLAIKDLAVDKNYPNILKEDFFELKVGTKGFEIPSTYRKRLVSTLGGNEREVTYPRWFDAIVGNPPYTRQEEIPEIGVDKNQLIENALKDGNHQLARISKRAGIHAYFFVHAWKFLKDDKYLGFIISNSWLDVDYGKGLQEFFLRHFKIVAIIESKVERWFTDADVNTCIVILQKCKNEKQRNENPVRFVYLKKTLRHFIPPITDDWDKQVERLHKIEALRKTVLSHTELYENDDFRIFPRLQKELWEEGFDKEKNKYEGAKWGKYLRAPQIFFKILVKGKNKFKLLKQLAYVKRGFTTGANEFFYLTEDEIKAKGIEKEFWMNKDENNKWIPNYLVKSPRECKGIVVNPRNLKYRVLMIHKEKNKLKGKKILDYIKTGEEKGINSKPTLSTRNRWYDLGIWGKPDLLWADAYNERFAIYDAQDYWGDKRFFYIYLSDVKQKEIINGFLNSTLIPLMIEIEGITNLGEGAVYTNVYQLKNIGIPIEQLSTKQKEIITALEKLKTRNINSIFDELGYSNEKSISLENIKPDRRELDKIIMGDILGLTEEEQLEVYKAVVDLVKSRIEKAKSVKKQKKIKEGIDVEAFVENVMDKIGETNIGNYYSDNILPLENLKTLPLPKATQVPEVVEDFFGWKLIYGKNKYIECVFEAEARYLKIFTDTSLDEIKIPSEQEQLKKAVKELQPIKEANEKVINEYVGSIVNKKMGEDLKQRVWRRVME